MNLSSDHLASIGSAQSGADSTSAALQREADASRQQPAGNTWLDDVTKPCTEAVLGLFGDHNASTIQTVNGYVKDFVKTVPLFLRGPAGFLGAMGAYAADSARPGDGIKTQLLDAALGGGEGLALKGGLEYLGTSRMSAAFKGVSLGVGATAAGIVFNPDTYKNSDGSMSAAAGMNNIEHQLFSSSTLINAAETAATFSVAEYGLGRLNYKMMGAFERSPYLPLLATGATFGFTSGALNETVNEFRAGHGYHPLSILGSALINGGIGAAAAGPGAYLEAQAALLPGRSLLDSTQTPPMTASDAIAKADHGLDDRQTELKSAPMTISGQVADDVYAASVTRANGDQIPVLYRTIDQSPDAVHRFQNETLAYKVNSLMGMDSMPATVGRSATIDGAERLGYVQELTGSSFEAKLSQQAGSGAKAISQYLQSDSDLLDSYKGAWMQRMMMQEWDNHGHQFLVDDTSGTPSVKSIDFEYGDPQAKFKQDLVPTWGKTASRASVLNERIASDLSGSALPDDALQKVQSFASRYSTPAGRQELSQYAASSAQVDGIVGRAQWFADNGTLPIKPPTNIFTYSAVKALSMVKGGSMRYEVTSSK